LPILYVTVPIALGVIVGRGTVNKRPWSKAFTGPSPAPRAWDHLFGLRPDGWVRLRLKSGVWLVGAFTSAGEGLDSYAAGHPDEQDLFLAEAYSVDPESGEFELDANGDVVSTGSAILVRWAEVEYLDFIDARGDRRGQGGGERREAFGWCLGAGRLSRRSEDGGSIVTTAEGARTRSQTRRQRFHVRQVAHLPPVWTGATAPLRLEHLFDSPWSLH
jgi:Family of unknown function (DUF6338)